MRQALSPSAGGLLLELRRVLTHLYDAAYLQRSPLIGWLRLDDLPHAVPGQEAKALRKAILEAIEELAPGENMPLRSDEYRAYRVLRGRYVDQSSLEELAVSLGIGERQLHRELRSGIEAIGAIITRRMQYEWPEAQPEGEHVPVDPQEDAVSYEADVLPLPYPQIGAEIGELISDMGPVNACSEVRNVAALVAPLARISGVALTEGELPESLVVRANRVVLRQVILALYTWSIQHQPGGTITSSAHWSGQEGALLELECAPEAGSSCEDPRPGVVPPALLEASQSTLQGSLFDDGRLVLRLTLPRMPMHTVLLIDDNLSMHRLFRRYLSGFPYRLLTAADASSGLAMARHERPAAIVLDIMIPGQDGWELLGILKTDPSTCGIPVVICTVLEQEALARSLSVEGYIRKPLTQNILLCTLQSLNLRSLL